MSSINRLYPTEFVYASIFLKGQKGAESGMTEQAPTVPRQRHRPPDATENNNAHHGTAAETSPTYSSFKEPVDSKEVQSESEDEVDPFSSEFRWDSLTLGQKVTLVLGCLTLAPLRAIFCIVIYGIIWLVSFIGVLGLTDEELSSSRLSKSRFGFRSKMQDFNFNLFRLMVWSFGFMDYQVTGVQASPEEAPIIVTAPHSTCVDIIPVIDSNSRPVAKKGMLGPIGKFMQLTIVNRSSKESRQMALESIKRRAEQTQEGLFPQTIIFPEGTCTNAKALIKFKVGAFHAGTPVQPMVVRPCQYREKDGTYRKKGIDTMTWTWNQNLSLFSLFYLTLAQPRSYFEIEYLPVYHPSEEEKKDPDLFGANVRAVMAKSLKVPELDIYLPRSYLGTKN